MKPKILLRVAAVLMLLHAIGHTFGVYGWKNPVNPQHEAVINGMVNDSYMFMGKLGGMGQFYEGFGYACTVGMLLMVAILWLASGVNEATAELVRKILITMTLILLAWGIDELVFFFPMAASFTFIAAAFTVVAILNLKKA
jgi:hypothetical protein